MTRRVPLLHTVVALAMLGVLPDPVPPPRRRVEPEPPRGPIPWPDTGRKYEPPAWQVEQDRLALKRISEADAKRARKAAKREAAAAKGVIGRAKT